MTAPRATETIYTLFADPVSVHRTETVFLDEERVDHLAYALGRHPPGIWLVALRDPRQLAAALVACWHTQHTPLISADLQHGTLQELASSLSGTIVEPDMDTFFPGRLPRIDGCIPLDPPHTAPPPHVDISSMRLAGERTALSLFTSGSTGHRKQVRKCFRELFEEVDMLDGLFKETRAAKRCISTVSPFHIYGLLFTVLWPLRHGHPPGDKQSLYWEEILPNAPDGPCVIISSPAHLRFLPHAAQKRTAALRHCTIFSSGGPLQTDVAAQLLNITGSAPIEILGSTETGGIARHTLCPGAGKIFYPFPGVHIRTDANGHLEVFSSWLPRQGVWLKTGDKAIRLQDGGFSLDGRVDRIAKIAGKRVSLREMESLLTQVPAVTAAKVIEIDMVPRYGRRALAAILVVSPDMQKEMADSTKKRPYVTELRRSLLSRFDNVVLPRIWRFVTAFPVDSQGKTTYTALQRIVDNDT